MPAGSEPENLAGAVGFEPTPSALQDQWRGRVGYGLFDVPLDDALPQMNRAGEVASRPLVVFANVHQRELLAGIDSPLHFAKVHFLHPSFRVIDDRKKSRSMFHGRPSR